MKQVVTFGVKAAMGIQIVGVPRRRALYRYTCRECQKPRTSLVYSRAIRGICHLHRVTEVNPNQQALFPQPNETAR